MKKFKDYLLGFTIGATIFATWFLHPAYHLHHWTKWSLMSHEQNSPYWTQMRLCEICGYAQMHIESANAPVK